MLVEISDANSDLVGICVEKFHYMQISFFTLEGCPLYRLKCGMEVFFLLIFKNKL
jgi:hypothetical protein